MEINEEVRKWLSERGRLGGLKSKRTFTPKQKAEHSRKIKEALRKKKENP